MDFFFKINTLFSNENIWDNDSNGWDFFSHGATNSCGALITSLRKTPFVLNEKKTGKAGRLLILDVKLDTDRYILINVFNANTEIEKLSFFKELQRLLKLFDIIQNKQILFAGGFNKFCKREVGY